MSFLRSPSRWLKRFIRQSTASLTDQLLDARPASRLIRSTARKLWLRLVMNLFFGLLQAGAEGATLGVVFLAVDLLSRSQSSKQQLQGWSGNHIVSIIPGLAEKISAVPLGVLFFCILAVAVLFKLAQSLSIYLAAVNIGHFTARVNAEVTALIHHQILRLSLACASQYPIGDLTYYASTGPSAVITQINLSSAIIVNILMASVYVVVLIFLSPWLLIAAATMACVLYFLQTSLLPRIQRRAFEGTEIAVAISTRITENIQGLRLLHASGQLDEADQSLLKKMGELEANTLASARLAAIIAPVSIFLPMAMIALIAGMSLIVFGTRNSGVLPSLVTFVVALQRLNGAFGAVASTFTGLSGNSAAIHRLNEILDPADKQFRRAGGHPFTQLHHAITLEQVTLRYGDSPMAAVRNLNLTIHHGQTVALVGASGAGKSSIADLLAGLYEPSEGRILIDGADLRSIDLISWQQKLGVVSQDTFLFNASLAYNIAFGTPGVSIADIRAAAAKAQADGFITSLPDGYDTLIGERGYRLSGGQRQRISLARAILRNPELLILDEATSALDSQSEQLVQQAIEQFERQHTVLVIAHRLSTIVNADLICVMDQGQIIERGNHAQLLSLNGIYASLWQQQIRQSGQVVSAAVSS